LNFNKSIVLDDDDDDDDLRCISSTVIRAATSTRVLEYSKLFVADYYSHFGLSSLVIYEVASGHFYRSLSLANL